MSKTIFTQEQQEELRKNPYTIRVTAHILSFSKEFKELFYREYMSGHRPKEILERYGYPTEIFSKERLEGIRYNITAEYRRYGCFSDIRSTKATQSGEKLLQEDKIRKLEHQVEYLTQEVEFLKKISSIRNTEK